VEDYQLSNLRLVIVGRGAHDESKHRIPDVVSVSSTRSLRATIAVATELIWREMPMDVVFAPGAEPGRTG